MKTKDLQDALTKRTITTPIPAKDFLSTGSINLNLACSGRINGGIPKGTYVFMPGQSSSGKTWITMSVFAEAKKSKRFKGYRLIRKDTERGALMDIPTYFGQEVADSIEWRDYPNTVESFYDDIDETLDAGLPFIYVLDSESGLQSEGGLTHIKKAKKARQSGKKGTGTFAGSVQKEHSQRLRTAVNRLEETGSILIVTGQTRKNMGLDSMFVPEVATGGEALFFWAHLRIWCRRGGKMTKEFNGRKRKVGDKVWITVDKSRITGKERKAKLLIPNDYGIDDTGSMVEFLLDEKKKDKIIKELGVKGKDVNTLAEAIEAAGKERQLKDLVKEVWDSIEEACVIRRKPRY